MDLLERMLGEQSATGTKKKADIEYIAEIEKFNPYHDSRGRFTTASGARSFTIRTRGGAYQNNMVNRAIEREKKRTAFSNYQSKISGKFHKLPRLDNEQAEKDRMDAIGKIEAKVNTARPFMREKQIEALDKEFEKYVAETDPKVWNKRAKMSRDDAWFDFKGMTREEAERKQRDLDAKRAEQKRQYEDTLKMRAAMDRAMSSNTKRAKEYREYETELFNKYKDDKKFGPDAYDYMSRATDAEKQKLKELKAALVMRDKNGKWRVAKSEDELWDDEWEYTENIPGFQKSVNSDVECLVELEKFNPFHDARGRFANKHTFSTYSANPKSRAGSMAISRSYHGGHNRTLNVHRESKGEDIGQNYRWMTSGAKPKSPAANNQAVQPRVKFGPNHPQNVGKPHKNRKTQPQQQNTNGKSTRTSATGRQIADGKDLTSAIKNKNLNKPLTLDDIAEMQGYKSKPEVITSKKAFADAVMRSGLMMYRTVSPGKDVVTKTSKTADEFIDDFKNGDSFSHNGTGAKAFGSGVYTASNVNVVQGQKPDTHEQEKARDGSAWYGNPGAKAMTMTLDPGAKIADYDDMINEFRGLTPKERRKYRDIGVYAAAKGYDAMRANQYDGTYYTIVYNRNALLVFDSVHSPYNATVVK